MQTNTVLATNDLSLTTFTSVLDQPVPVLEHSKASSGLSGILRNLGASNHTPEERQPDDFYATDPRAASLLLDVEEFSGKIWECACGQGDLSKVFERAGHDVISTDLVYRGYGCKVPVDFLSYEGGSFDGDIITNPPYKYASEFVEKALNTVSDGHKVAMFLKLLFLEGKARKELFKKYPPKTVYVMSSRMRCAKDGDFDKYRSSAVAYAWYVWEKGYTGNPTIKWIN